MFRLSDSKATTQIRPPQGSVTYYGDLLKLLEKRNIPKIDKSFLEHRKIAKGNEGKLIAGLKFLGLIDDEGNAKEAMDSLSVVGDKRTENIEKVVRNAYSLLFDEVELDLENAQPENLINCFKTDYGMGSPVTAKQAAKIFTFLAQKAEIALSQSIVDELTIKERKRPTRTGRRKRERPPEDQGMKEQLKEDVLARLTLKDIGIIDVKDKDTFKIAQAYMNLLSKKLRIDEEEED